MPIKRKENSELAIIWYVLYCFMIILFTALGKKKKDINKLNLNKYDKPRAICYFLLSTEIKQTDKQAKPRNVFTTGPRQQMHWELQKQ